MKYRRALKRFFTKRSEYSKLNKPSFNSILMGLAILSVVMFVTVQLVTNAVLSPLGHKLQSLNTEKNQLIEENRILEQEIAKANSITVIEVYSKDRFDLDEEGKRETMFVSNKSVQAINLK